jgi:hypothetical protein
MRSNPTNTRSVFERSPMMFLTGRGSLRTSVGTARIWLSRASRGFFKRSITSMRYLPSNCSSQITVRLLRAVTALGLCPAIYRRNNHLPLPGFAGGFFRRTVFELSRLISNAQSPECFLFSWLCHSTPVLFTRRLSGSSPFLPCPELNVYSFLFLSR